MGFLLIMSTLFGVYFAGWLHGRGTAHWTLHGYSSRALRREIEEREKYGERP